MSLLLPFASPVTLSSCMIYAGKRNRVQSDVAPSASPAHPLAAVLGDLLKVTRSLAESVSVLLCCFSFPSILLPTLCLQIARSCMLMPCYRQARRRRVWSSLAQEDNSPSDDSTQIENSASPQL
jgi:hypothetical protein